MTQLSKDDEYRAVTETTKLIQEEDCCHDQTGASQKPPKKIAERYLLYKDAPIEATGCCIDAFARSTIFMAAFFVGPALLKLAEQQAIEVNHCSPDDETCAEAARIYGFKPSSLLTNMKSIASFTSMLLLPLFGAVVDSTPYRKQVGMFTAFAVVGIKGMELVVGPSTWFFVVCIQVLSDLLYELHTATTESYAAEITNKPMDQSKYQSAFSGLIFVSMFLYVLEVTVLSTVGHMSLVGTARLSVLLSIVNSGPLLVLGWIHYFRDRPPSSKLSETKMILTAGFRKLVATFREISSKYKPVRHFLVYSVAWSEAAVASLPLIATTYMTDYLKFSSQEIGVALLMTMIGGIPGSFVGYSFSKLYQNPVRSAQLCLVVFTINTLLAGMLLRPDNRHWLFAFALVWGLCEGWLKPQNSTIFVTIAPVQKGAVELMGLYMFSRNVMTFFPPMFFTILNEVGIPMWVGISSLAIYSTMGLIGLTTMVDYEIARSLVLTIAQ